MFRVVLPVNIWTFLVWDCCSSWMLRANIQKDPILGPKKVKGYQEELDTFLSAWIHFIFTQVVWPGPVFPAWSACRELGIG